MLWLVTLACTSGGGDGDDTTVGDTEEPTEAAEVSWYEVHGEVAGDSWTSGQLSLSLGVDDGSQPSCTWTAELSASAADLTCSTCTFAHQLEFAAPTDEGDGCDDAGALGWPGEALPTTLTVGFESVEESPTANGIIWVLTDDGWIEETDAVAWFEQTDANAGVLDFFIWRGEMDWSVGF